jgi:hypothetical protein
MEDNQFWEDNIGGLDVSGYEDEANEYIEMATRAVKEREVMETQLDDFANWDGTRLGYELGAEEERDAREIAVQELQACDDEALMDEMLSGLGKISIKSPKQHAFPTSADSADVQGDGSVFNARWYPYSSKIVSAFWLLP